MKRAKKKSVNSMKTDDAASCFKASGLYSGGHQFKQSLMHLLCCSLRWQLLASYVSWHHSNTCVCFPNSQTLLILLIIRHMLSW